MIAILLTLSVGQLWNWTEPAPHHLAAVRILSGEGGTCGALVEHQGRRGVLSCAHGKSGTCTVTFSDGTRKTARYTHDKFKHDVAWVDVDNPNIEPLKLASAAPQPGEWVEIMGFGGPRDTLRHFSGTVRDTSSSMTWLNARVINGDSGGAILNAQHEVVGVQSVGEGDNATSMTIDGSRWPVYQAAGIVRHDAMLAFAGRVATQGGACPGGQCPPLAPDGGSDAYPPDQWIPQQPQQPAPQPNVEAIVAAVLARIKAEPGPAGPPGPQGPAGPAGDAEITQEHLDYVVAEILKQMNADPERFRGPPGNPPDTSAIVDAVIARLEPISLLADDGAGGLTPLGSARPGEQIVLPPLHVRSVTDSGEVRDEVRVRIGGVLNLNHRPIPN